MNNRLSPKQAALYRRIDEVLTYVWDPIGIKEIPQARDEYESYLPHVFSLVVGSTAPEVIAEYLLSVEGERMGLSINEGSRESALRVAELLTKHWDWLNGIPESITSAIDELNRGELTDLEFDDEN